MSENVTWANVTGPDLPIGYGLVVYRHYRFYYLGAAKIVFLGIIPLGSLTFLSWKTYCGAKRSPILSGGEENQEQQRREHKMAQVSIQIVTAFIVCHTFRVLIEIDNLIDFRKHEICYEAGKEMFSLWSYIIDPIRELMTTLSCSVNVVIYFYVTKREKIFSGRSTTNAV